MDVGYLLVTAGVVLLDSRIKRYVDKAYVCGESHSWGGMRLMPVTGGKRQDGPRKNKPGRIVIEKYYNKGAALNFLERRPKQMRVIHVCMLLVAGFGYVVLLCSPGKQFGKMGMALLVGGGASNLCDRLLKGHVVDYFRIDAGPKRFRRIIFNISDFCIFAGAFLAVVGAAWGESCDKNF